MSHYTICSGRNRVETLSFVWPDSPPVTPERFVFVDKVVVTVKHPMYPKISPQEIRWAVAEEQTRLKEKVHVIKDAQAILDKNMATLNQSLINRTKMHQLLGLGEQMGLPTQSLQDSLDATNLTITEILHQNASLQRTLLHKNQIDLDFNAVSRLIGWLNVAPLEIIHTRELEAPQSALQRVPSVPSAPPMEDVMVAPIMGAFANLGFSDQPPPSYDDALTMPRN